MVLFKSHAAKSRVTLKSILISCLLLVLAVNLNGGVGKAAAQSTCFTATGGFWSNPIWDCGGGALTTIPSVISAGDVVEINPSATVTLDSTIVIDGALNIHGRLVVNAPHEIINNQFMNVLGELTSQDATVDNQERLSILGSYFNNGQARLKSTDLTSVSGNLENGPQATVQVTDGSMEISGTFNNHGSLALQDPADITVSGTLFNQVVGEVDNNGAGIDVPASGVIENFGKIKNFNQGEIVNEGQIENLDSGIVQSTDQGSKIVNQDGGIIINSGGDLINENKSVVHNQPLAIINVASGIFRNKPDSLVANQGRIRIGSGGALLNGATVLNWWCTSSIVVEGNYINDRVTNTAPGKVITVGAGQLLGNPLTVVPGCI